MKIKAILLISFFTAFFFLPLRSSPGFTLNNSLGASFLKDEVFINVAEKQCEKIPLSPKKILDLAYEGANKYWNRVSTSALKFSRGSILSVREVFYSEPICEENLESNSCELNEALKVEQDILIICNNNEDNFGDRHILASSLPNNIKGLYIYGAIIALNDREDSSFGKLNREEQIATLAHEIGHAIGLGHSQFPESLMYYSIDSSPQMALGQDDWDGVTFLYPRQQPFNACGTVGTGGGMSGGMSSGGGGMTFAFLLGLLMASLMARWCRRRRWWRMH